MTGRGAVNLRGEAAAYLARWLESGAFPDRMIRDDATGHAFLVELVYGAVKQRRRLEWLLRRLAPRKPEPGLFAFVLAGLYQVFDMTDTAAFAAVHETVEAVKARRPAGDVRFVNAVLRRALREREALLAELAAQPAAIRLSHPDGLAARWIARFGQREAEALMAWNNERPPVILRVNRLRAGMDEALARLREGGVEAEPEPARPDECIRLGRGSAVGSLPGWDEGWYVVQDPAALLAVDLLDPQPGEAVLDGCAAPGGKLTAVAERMRGAGRLVAVDLHADRLSMIRGASARLGLDWIELFQGDMADAAWVRDLLGEGLFDRVLLDVPCSNTGVLRRRPDARWRFTPGRLEALCRMQRALLESASALVKPGGILVYSTCSLEPEEGEVQIGEWLASRPDYSMDDAQCLVPPGAGMDGAYAARLRRRED